MRRSVSLAVVMWSASAAADPAFTAAPLAGALEAAVAGALTTTDNLAAPSDRLDAFSGVTSIGPTGPIAIGGPPRPRDSFGSNEIDRVMYASKAAIKRCYQTELENNKELSGKVVVAFTIGANGSVASATIKRTTLGSPPAEACIVAEIKKLRFPPKGPASVTYPFIFSRG